MGGHDVKFATGLRVLAREPPIDKSLCGDSAIDLLKPVRTGLRHCKACSINELHIFLEKEEKYCLSIFSSHKCYRMFK